MGLAAVDNTAFAARLAMPRPAERSADGFAALLRSAGGRTPEAEAREAAQQLVASALVAPMLAEVRDQPLDAKLFDAGPGSDAFRQQLDTILADRIVRSAKFPLVDRIYESVMQRAPGSAPGSAGPGPNAGTVAGVDRHG